MEATEVFRSHPARVELSASAPALPVQFADLTPAGTPALLLQRALYQPEALRHSLLGATSAPPP
jgi:hypothetical protein